MTMARTYGWCSLRKNHIDMPSETSPGANGAAKRNCISQCNGLAAISLSSLLSVPNEHNTADQEAWPDAQGSPGYNPDVTERYTCRGIAPEVVIVGETAIVHVSDKALAGIDQLMKKAGAATSAIRYDVPREMYSRMSVRIRGLPSIGATGVALGPWRRCNQSAL